MPDETMTWFSAERGCGVITVDDGGQDSSFLTRPSGWMLVKVSKSDRM